MTRDDFMQLVGDRLNLCRELLDKKKEEYGPGDNRLEQFYTAAALMQCLRPTDALMGMMVKHTTSIYAMLAHPHRHTRAMWCEKITDQINYLLLLEGLLCDLYWKEPKDE
jgi:hypothetical protein